MDNKKDSYTKREFKRNKGIFLIIKLIIIAGCLLLISYLLYALIKVPLTPLVIVFLAIIFFVAFKFMYSFFKQNRSDEVRNDKTWGKGLEAEETVGKSLLALPSEYKIIEDLNTGRGNIDVIVIGPTGLFVIEVKAMKGVVSYQNGQLAIDGRVFEKDYIVQTEAERQWLTHTLKQYLNLDYKATGLLLFPYGKTDKATINGPIKSSIWIGEGNFHRYLIDKSRNYLTTNEVERIYTLLNNLKNKSS
jgi:membrane protein implicated in regulation of membrane protease activity